MHNNQHINIVYSWIIFNYNTIEQKRDFLKLISIWGGCPSDVMFKAMDCGIVVREFVLQSRFYIRANTLGKGTNSLILPAMG